jgi:hypothetical protein
MPTTTPLMPTISPFIRIATATAHAPQMIRTIARSKAKTASPAAWSSKPNGTLTATITAADMRVHTSQDRIGPIRRANLLAGVTRRRSVKPFWSSKIVVHTTIVPPLKKEQGDDAGEKRLNDGV